MVLTADSTSLGITGLRQGCLAISTQVGAKQFVNHGHITAGSALILPYELCRPVQLRVQNNDTSSWKACQNEDPEADTTESLIVVSQQRISGSARLRPVELALSQTRSTTGRIVIFARTISDHAEARNSRCCRTLTIITDNIRQQSQ